MKSHWGSSSHPLRNVDRVEYERRWNPWKALRDRSHLTLKYADLGILDGAIIGETITLNTKLDRRGRNAALAHELLHDERGITFPYSTWATMEHEEEQVRREVVRRLLPPWELRDYLQSRTGAVLVYEVAEHFEVPDWLAAQALRLYRMRMAA